MAIQKLAGHTPSNNAAAFGDLAEAQSKRKGPAKDNFASPFFFQVGGGGN